MESTDKDKNYERIQYANIYQSLHIGCKRYGDIDPNYKDVSETHVDVEKYKSFFKDKL